MKAEDQSNGLSPVLFFRFYTSGVFASADFVRGGIFLLRQPVFPLEEPWLFVLRAAPERLRMQRPFVAAVLNRQQKTFLPRFNGAGADLRRLRQPGRFPSLLLFLQFIDRTSLFFCFLFRTARRLASSSACDLFALLLFCSMRRAISRFSRVSCSASRRAASSLAVSARQFHALTFETKLIDLCLCIRQNLLQGNDRFQSGGLLCFRFLFFLGLKRF